ncbi:STAS domain-containing protein [Halobacillus sp. Marseille-Q1614]|uniref:STAS domain-containing protein n=1 Tax=Halobacillus sp. Marseille-Q1614 TaxID=2709134 RepID=UPI00157034F1|nr:STAS domain-containing protein [Halobacillus sp. Marseille-Q1614]
MQQNQDLIMIGKKIEERKYEFADAMKQEENEAPENREFRAELFQLFADGLQKGNEATKDEVNAWGEHIGRLAIEQGAQLDNSLKGTMEFRVYLWNALEDITKEEDFSKETIFKVARSVDPLLDHIVYAFSTSFVHSYKASLEKAHQEFLNLSAPVVPLLNGVAVMPIIGSVDEKRAYYMMDTTLNEAMKQQLSYLLIDLSSVTMIDTHVANSIAKIVTSLDLLGVTAILAGIRPEVAHTMVSLGIDFSEIKTYNSLQQALSIHVFGKRE